MRFNWVNRFSWVMRFNWVSRLSWVLRFNWISRLSWVGWLTFPILSFILIVASLLLDLLGYLVAKVLGDIFTLFLRLITAVLEGSWGTGGDQLFYISTGADLARDLLADLLVDELFNLLWLLTLLKFTDLLLFIVAGLFFSSVGHILRKLLADLFIIILAFHGGYSTWSLVALNFLLSGAFGLDVFILIPIRIVTSRLPIGIVSIISR